MKKVLFWIFGLVVCLAGISLVLVFWQDVVALFRGVVGGVLAVAGLAMMAMARD